MSSAGPSEFSASIGIHTHSFARSFHQQDFSSSFFLYRFFFFFLKDADDDDEDEEGGKAMQLSSDSGSGEMRSERSDDELNDGDDDDDDEDEDRGLNFGVDVDEDDKEDPEEVELQQEEVDSMMRAFQENARLEMEKAKHVETQNKVWQRLLGLRIKMQGVLSSANTLPGPDDADDLRLRAGDALRHSVCESMAQLASLRGALLGRHPELPLSHSLPPVPQQESSDVWWSWLAESNAASRDAEAAVVKSANERANLQSGRTLKVPKTQKESPSFFTSCLQAFGRPLMEQISHSLTHDREKLIRRTQLNRSGVPPLRSKRARDGAKIEPYHDDNIFDDSEFYGQLLKSFLESSSAVTGGRVLARDTRVKKARVKKAKVSLAIQDKLLNFMAPTASNVLPPMADALFGSLFGQVPQAAAATQ